MRYLVQHTIRNLLFSFLFSLAVVSAAPAEPVPVLVSIMPQQWLAELVDGSLIRVHVLLDKGHDHHAAGQQSSYADACRPA